MSRFITYSTGKRGFNGSGYIIAGIVNLDRVIRVHIHERVHGRFVGGEGRTERRYHLDADLDDGSVMDFGSFATHGEAEMVLDEIIAQDAR